VRRGLFYGWTVVAGAFLGYAISQGLMHSYAVFLVAYLGEFGWGRAETSVAYSVSQLVVGISSPLVGALVDRLGTRVLVAAGAVLLGTLYPLLLDALGLGKISVGPPYFDTVFVPLMTPALFLMGVGPVARWREAGVPDLARRLRWALGVSVVSALLVPLVLGQWTPMRSFGLLIAFWVFASTAYALAATLRSQSGRGLLARLRSVPRAQLGMLLAHAGIGVFVVGVTMVKSYEIERDLKMDLGDTAEVGGYTFRFDGVRDVRGPNYTAARGTVSVLRDGTLAFTLHPEKRSYSSQEPQMTEASIHTGLTRDLYVSLGEPVDSAGAWTVRIYYKPFVVWIWGGCVLMALGGLLAASDRRYRAAVRRREAPAAEGKARPGRGALPQGERG